MTCEAIVLLYVQNTYYVVAKPPGCTTFWCAAITNTNNPFQIFETTDLEGGNLGGKFGREIWKDVPSRVRDARRPDDSVWVSYEWDANWNRNHPCFRKRNHGKVIVQCEDG